MACLWPGRCSTVPEREFTKARILHALQALGKELTHEGVRAQIFIVGGASMALAYSTRRVTKDIDAVFEPKQTVYAAAAKVAEELGLPEDWLNDAVKGFLRDKAPRPVLAMKLMAMRFGEDDEDIEILLRECDLHSTEEALDVLKQVYPAKEPPAKTRYFLEELLGS
jgi:hypothetical protein